MLFGRIEAPDMSTWRYFQLCKRNSNLMSKIPNVRASLRNENIRHGTRIYFSMYYLNALGVIINQARATPIAALEFM